MDHRRADKHADTNWPAWRYGPNGESDVFDSAAEVPAGWHDHPSKHAQRKPAPGEVLALDQGKPNKATGTAAQTGAGGNTSTAPADFDRIDAHGHKWDAKLHAATKSMTKDGLWRMKVGVARPAPVKGYPKPDVTTPTDKGKPVESQALDL